MTTSKISFMAIAVLSGFLGGWVAMYLLSSRPVSAQVGERFPLTTTGLTIVNQAGQPRASLKLWDGEHPVLLLSDQTCDRRVSLMVARQEQATLTFFGADCKRRVALEVQADDQPSLVLRDANDVPRARLHLLDDGSPVLALYDPTGDVLYSKP